MAVRRQEQWEAQLRENAFLIGTVKRIVDEAVAFNFQGTSAIQGGFSLRHDFEKSQKST